jgi:phosphoketolase
MPTLAPELLEGNYSEIDPNISQDEAGLKNLFTAIRNS